MGLSNLLSQRSNLLLPYLIPLLVSGAIGVHPLTRKLMGIGAHRAGRCLGATEANEEHGNKASTLALGIEPDRYSLFSRR